MGTTEKDGVFHNPEFEALITEAHELADADVRADVEPRSLTGRLVDVQFYYDEHYLERLLARGQN